MDFKEDGFMFLLGAIVILSVIAESVFFLVRAVKRGKALGMTAQTMKNAAAQSALFTIAPSFAIVATLVALTPSLGIVLPWIRNSVIGNITQETTAATTALDALGGGMSLASPVTDKNAFALILWVMTLASALPLILIPLFLKRVQKGIKKAAKKRDPKWVDLMSAAAFLGIICSFLARSIAGIGSHNTLTNTYNYDGAGLVSVAALLSSVVCMLILQSIANKRKIRWLDEFAMPLSMFFAMGVVVALSLILPVTLYQLEWRVPAA